MSKEFESPIEKLFGSKTRSKLLKLFFENSDKSFYVREITRLIEEQINSVRRELTNLEAVGIIKQETYENKVYYSANSKHAYYKPFLQIFSVKVPVKKDKDVREGTWAEYIQPVKNFMKGLVVINRPVGVEGLDLLIIGDDKTKKLSHWAEMVEKKVGKPLNYSIMDFNDFVYRKSVRDKFVLSVLAMDVKEIYDPEKVIRDSK